MKTNLMSENIGNKTTTFLESIKFAIIYIVQKTYTQQDTKYKSCAMYIIMAK